MAKKKQECNCPKCLPGWLAAFGDLMSLLLCFFVLLLSMSSMDARKVEDALGSLAGALSVLEGGSKTEISREKQQQDNPIQKDTNSASSSKISKQIKNAKNALQEINEILESSGSPKATLEESEDGFIIQLPASLLFKPSSAAIENEDALLFLRRISLIVKKMPKHTMLDVVGFTDNGKPSKNSIYKDNWALSTARGVSVARELIKAKVDPKRLIASGRASYDPIATNATEEGRAKNRRVELHFYSSQTKNDSKEKKTILDMANK